MASKVEESELRAMFDRIDTDRSVSTYYIFKGFIDYTEFISAAASFKIHEDSIKEAFDLFDQDGNGFIELDELKEILVHSINIRRRLQ
jgi:Ca2+-binding EF-hand superfamily protein